MSFFDSVLHHSDAGGFQLLLCLYTCIGKFILVVAGGFAGVLFFIVIDTGSFKYFFCSFFGFYTQFCVYISGFLGLIYLSSKIILLFFTSFIGDNFKQSSIQSLKHIGFPRILLICLRREHTGIFLCRQFLCCGSLGSECHCFNKCRSIFDKQVLRIINILDSNIQLLELISIILDKFSLFLKVVSQMIPLLLKGSDFSYLITHLARSACKRIIYFLLCIRQTSSI